jgi:hypothetical protein
MVVIWQYETGNSTFGPILHLLAQPFAASPVVFLLHALSLLVEFHICVERCCYV